MLEQTPYLLIADDTPDVLEMLKFAVEERGWRCDTATTPEEIEAKVRENCDEQGRSCFDALVCDVYFKEAQGRTGVSAIRNLRQQFPNLPVIFITAWDVNMVRGEALKVGQEVIVKPFNVDYILERVMVWVSFFQPQTFLGHDRRRYGMNRSGMYRRKTDQMVIPTELPHQPPLEAKRKRA